MSDYYRNLSLILSHLMDDIGVSEETVMRRRRSYLVTENSCYLLGTLIRSNFTEHTFGSQTEGTTTPGLHSDIDTLIVCENINVIHDRKDWVPGKVNLLMIQDDVLRPGYCKLQRLRNDMPLAMEIVPDDEDYMYDDQRRVLMKSTYFASGMDRFLPHGPALNLVESGEGNNDFVFAFPSPALSDQYKEWSSRQRSSNWLSLDMIEHMGNLRCFVVPYVHLEEEELPNIDWRISTSLAERFLMFSLNITQIRCYVLLKMIVKTFITPNVPDVISSYICKTLLFHCLDRTKKDFWIEPNLVRCVNHVLLYMLAAVHTKDCPNYFNESSNLFFGKIDDEIQEQLLTRISELVKSKGRFLLRIGMDDLNSRLSRCIRDRNLMLSFDEKENNKKNFYAKQTLGMCIFIGGYWIDVLRDIENNEISRDRFLSAITDLTKNGGVQHRTAIFLLPFICSYLATVDACQCILIGKDISPKTLQLYRLSLSSDSASSRLKYASFLYCTGQLQGALSVMQDLERSLTGKVVSVCPCTNALLYITDEFCEEERHKLYPSASNVAFCVMFTRAEIQCCPREMQFEFYRSTEEDKLHRDSIYDRWMDLAVLDCLPYLYYVQYMTARHLGQPDLQYRALQNLESRVCSEDVLGHRETAYNVLGQCLELENNIDRAMMYYRMSLQVQPRHNAAIWHVTRLCFDVFTRKTKKQCRHDTV